MTDPQNDKYLLLVVLFFLKKAVGYWRKSGRLLADEKIFSPILLCFFVVKKISTPSTPSTTNALARFGDGQGVCYNKIAAEIL